MKICKLCDCSKANNKCKECEYNSECDYVWINDLWNKNSKLLTPPMPIVIKENLRKNKIISYTGNKDFCMYNPGKLKTTIQDIVVEEELRGQHIASKLIDYLLENYSKDISIKCIKDSSAEKFWCKKGVKLEEEQSKKEIVCTYIIKNNLYKLQKSQLW